jgi:glycerol-3-phosphate dehydrogenase (NAD(P)+)
MRVTVLGTGSWGFCLAYHLAKKGFQVTCWTVKKELMTHLKEKGEHPLFPGHPLPQNMRFTLDLEKAIKRADFVVESVTSAGFRSVMEQINQIHEPHYPIVMTSKGIEQKTGFTLSEVAFDVFGESIRPHMGALSGPSFAQDVIRGLPTSVAGSAYDEDVMMLICHAFTTSSFRVYPNKDMVGLSFGGALKNVIAIACGVCEGLHLGESAKAALMTRGLHEITKLAVARGGQKETLFGLSGMGDLCLTCSSSMSRNTRFGLLLSKGLSKDQAKDEIGTVVEGAYTVVSALYLSKSLNISMPITEMVYKILYEKLPIEKAVESLMQRVIKEEHL